MPIEIQRWITRQDLRDNPKKLFVFGDNMAEQGLGGQAYHMRGEPNAVGIPTKFLPSMQANAFFTDADLPKVEEKIRAKFRLLKAHIDAGGTVVWPEHDIGTGRAQLQTKAPRIAQLIQNLKQHLEE